MRSNDDLALYKNVIYLPILNTVLAHVGDRSIYYTHKTRKYWIYSIPIHVRLNEKEANTFLYEDKY